MGMQYSVAHRNARLEALHSAIGSSPVLRIFDGDPPVNCAAAANGTILATLTLPADWAGLATNGRKLKLGTWQDLACDATGRARYFRMYNAAGSVCHMQGSVGTTLEDDLIIDSVFITAGQVLTVQLFQIDAGGVIGLPPPPVVPGGFDPSTLISAPAPTNSQYTTNVTSVETYPAGEWPSARRDGPWIGENNNHSVNQWGLSYVSDRNASITSGQYHQSVGLGTATSEKCVSGVINIKWPTGLTNPPGYEVPNYPSFLAGQGLGWSAYQLMTTPGMPIKIADIDHLYIGWKSRTRTNTSSFFKGHLVHDMWVAFDPSPSSGDTAARERITAEVMIVHESMNSYGLLPGGRPAGSHRGTVTIAGYQFNIYTQQGGSVMLPSGNFCAILAFVPVSGILPDQYDFGDVYKFMRTTRYNQLPNGAGTWFQRDRGATDFIIDPNSYLVQDSIGIEFDGSVGGEYHEAFDTLYFVPTT